MLSACYFENPQLYASFGCFRKSLVKDVEYKKYTKSLGSKSKLGLPRRTTINIHCLSFDIQRLLHARLKNIANKSNGVFKNPKSIADYLNNPFTRIKLHNSLKSKRNQISADIVLNEVCVVYGNDGITDIDDARNLLQLQSIFGYHASDQHDRLPIIRINHELFDTVTPGYIKSLYPYMEVLVIPFGTVTIDYENCVFKWIFKQWLIPNERGILPSVNKRGTQNYVVANLTLLPDETVRRLNRGININFIDTMDTMLTFRNSNGSVSKYQLRRSAVAINDYAAKELSTLYDTLFTHGKPDEPLNHLSYLSVCTSFVQIPRVYVNERARAFINKVLDRIRDPRNVHVNINMIGNKGGGKSKLSELIAAKLTSLLNEEVHIVSSDSYGVWKRYHLSNPKCNTNVDYADYANVTHAKGESYFSVLADSFLANKKIRATPQYDNLSRKKRRELINIFKEILAVHFVTDASMNEDYFYDMMNCSAYRSRIVIFESHASFSDSNLPGSDITFNNAPVINTRLCVRGRDNENLTELFLHDVYELFDIQNHVSIYPYEWEAVLSSYSLRN
uniref:Uncharacterized protein n=1 Tax=Torrey Pines virus TaxID=1654361 RepID=A0A2Z4QKX7_9REOV|nr:hypothetical protein [Torrey Pines virus]